MSCGIIKGDKLTWTGGCGRSRSYHAEFPTWKTCCLDRLTGQHKGMVFSVIRKKTACSRIFFNLSTLVKMLGEIIMSLGNIKSKWYDCGYF